MTRNNSSFLGLEIQTIHGGQFTNARLATDPELAGGFRDRVPLYDTEGGWLHLSTEELVSGALSSKQAGWSGVKVKVGKPRASEDVNDS